MTPKIIKDELIYSGKILSVSRVDLQMPDGPVVQREIVHHKESVGILPIAEDGRFLFVRQFRPPAGRALLELPAGSLEEGEEPEACAQRELCEEVGFQAGALRKVAGFYLAPGWATEFMHGFIARGLSENKLPGDEDEDIEVVYLTPAESLQAIAAGEIVDCKSVALIGLYFANQQSGSDIR